jgi:cytosine deaminase
MDLIVRNARLRDGKTVEIGIEGGKIAAIADKVSASAGQEIDAQGNLVTESFVNPHLHLCKVYTLQMMDEEAL